MSRRIRTALLRSSIVMAALAIGIAAALRGWIPGVSLGAAAPPILVFVVSDPAGVDRLAARVDPARVLHAEPGTIALAEGRIFTADVGAASRPINELGWKERDIQILEPGAGDGTPESAGSSLGPEARMARLRSLVDKRRLSVGEQIFVLKAMNDELAL